MQSVFLFFIQLFGSFAIVYLIKAKQTTETSLSQLTHTQDRLFVLNYFNENQSHLFFSIILSKCTLYLENYVSLLKRTDWWTIKVSGNLPGVAFIGTDMILCPSLSHWYNAVTQKQRFRVCSAKDEALNMNEENNETPTASDTS